MVDEKTSDTTTWIINQPTSWAGDSGRSWSKNRLTESGWEFFFTTNVNVLGRRERKIVFLDFALEHG